MAPEIPTIVHEVWASSHATASAALNVAGSWPNDCRANAVVPPRVPIETEKLCFVASVTMMLAHMAILTNPKDAN